MLNIENGEKYKNQFIDIIRKQFELNSFTAGKQWHISGVNEKTGKIINWNRCSWMEMAEFVDSFDWKHWKKGSNNTENAKVELIDILHFLISQLIVEEYNVIQYINKTETEVLEEVYTIIANRLSIAFLLNNYEEDDIFKLADLFVSGITSNLKINDLTLFIFTKLCILNGLTVDELYKGYMIKNILNKFRQDNGYNSGEYIKQWNYNNSEVEDNVVAYETSTKLINENKNVSEYLYEELSNIYKNMNN
jgi:hypothetical protein